MSYHAYCRNWLHLIWATKNREPLIVQPEARIEISNHLKEYSREKGIYMKINNVYRDHVHSLIDLPGNICAEDAVKLLKGETSHWINQNRIIPVEFFWQRGYGAFSVSQSMVSKVCQYIANQVEHHRKKTMEEELRAFVKTYGLVWRDEGGYEKAGE